MRGFRHYILCFLIYAGSVATGLAQQQKGNAEKLALQYYEAGEFEKANDYFSDLYESNPGTWYPMYFKSLLSAKDYDKAEKITKKQLRISKYNVNYYVQLGQVYQLKQEPKKEKESYDKALKELVVAQPYIYNLATAFLEIGKYEYALAVYDKARKATPDYPYFYERAEIYRQKNDLRAMINEYLDALDFRESELETVQARLQNSLGYDDETGGINNPLLKQELLKRIEKQPDKVVFSEFYIFILKQQGDFNAAFLQSRALDKRLREDGRRVFDLGRICVANQNWDCAKRCFEYVMEKGPSGVYYNQAQVEGLNAEFLFLTLVPVADTTAMHALETKLEQAYKNQANPRMRLNLLKNLCNLQAFYLGKSNRAIQYLLDYFETEQPEPAIKAELKLLLGDIYLLVGEIWEASLLYSQVEKDFKYETIAQDAKFRNAKLSYYAGDFAWAKTQADILKGATSKLIANDALDLSLVISDAIGVDTNDAPLRIFSRADLLIVQHRYTEGLQLLDSINLLFSSHTLGDDIYYKKASVFEKLLQAQKAEEMYKAIVEYFPDGLYGDDAQFKLALLYEQAIKDNSRAQAAYQEVLTRYPGSIYTVEARKRYRQLRGDAQHN